MSKGGKSISLPYGGSDKERGDHTPKQTSGTDKPYSSGCPGSNKPGGYKGGKGY